MTPYVPVPPAARAKGRAPAPSPSVTAACVLKLDSVLNEIALRPGTSVGVTGAVLKLAWSSVCRQIERALLQRRGIVVPGFAHFGLRHVSQEEGLWGTKTRLAPTVTLLGVYAAQHGIQVPPPLGHVHAHAPGQLLSLCGVCSEAGLAKDVVGNSVKDICRRIGEVASSGAMLTVECGFCRLLFQRRRFAVCWNQSFLSKLGDVGDRLNHPRLRRAGTPQPGSLITYQADDTGLGPDLAPDPEEVASHRRERLRGSAELAEAAKRAAAPAAPAAPAPAPGGEEPAPRLAAAAPRPPSAPSGADVAEGPVAGSLPRRPASAGSRRPLSLQHQTPPQHPGPPPEAGLGLGEASEAAGELRAIKQLREQLLARGTGQAPPSPRAATPRPPPSRPLSARTPPPEPAAGEGRRAATPRPATPAGPTPAPPQQRPHTARPWSQRTEPTSEDSRSVPPPPEAPAQSAVEEKPPKRVRAAPTSLTAYQQKRRLKLWWRRQRNQAFSDVWDAQLKAKHLRREVDRLNDQRFAAELRSWIGEEEARDKQAKATLREHALRVSELNRQLADMRTSSVVGGERGTGSVRRLSPARLGAHNAGASAAPPDCGSGGVFGASTRMQPLAPDAAYLRRQMAEKREREQRERQIDREESAALNAKILANWEKLEDEEKKAKMALQQRLRRDYRAQQRRLRRKRNTEVEQRRRRAELAHSQPSGDFFFSDLTHPQLVDFVAQERQEERRRAVETSEANRAMVAEQVQRKREEAAARRSEGHKRFQLLQDISSKAQEREAERRRREQRRMRRAWDEQMQNKARSDRLQRQHDRTWVDASIWKNESSSEAPSDGGP